MSTNFDTILPIKDRYWCQIARFVRVHDTLSIHFSEANSSKKLFIVDFVSVCYHSGPFHWVSNSYDIALPEDCAAVLRQIRGFDNISESELFNRVNRRGDNYKLYQSRDGDLTTKIIATGAYLFSPEEYYP